MLGLRDLPESGRLTSGSSLLQSYLEQNWAESITAEVDRMTERLIGYASSGQEIKLLQEMIVSLGRRYRRRLWRQGHDG